jgi:hypothetical protein
MTGTVKAGALGIVGATVKLWSSGTTATQLGATATTTAGGSFGLTFTCPSPGTLMYVTATGGHVGSGAANAAVELTSALGACGSLPVSIVVNELTSAAAAYALSGFAAPTGGSPSVSFQGKSPGLNQAFNALTNLTVTSTGAFETTGPETNQLQVQQTLDTLANAMAACDVSSPAGAACLELFSCAQINAAFVSTGAVCTGGTSPAPTDTLSAALAVTLNAGTVGLQGIWDVGTTTGNLYSATVLAASPNDWTLPMVYSLTNRGPLAIDGSGHIWVLSVDPSAPAGTPNPSLAVIELDANFNKLSPLTTGWNGGGVHSFDNTDLTNLAIDTAGNVWIGGSTTIIAELNSQGAPVSPAGGWVTASGPSATGPDGTAGVAIDSVGDAWFASGLTASTVYEMSPLGAPLSPAAGDAASNCPCNGIAADPSGNIWTAGPQPGALAEMTGGVQVSILHPPGFAVSDYLLGSVASDAAGDIWVTDQHNHGVWEYTSGGTWLPAATGGPNPAPFPNISALNDPSVPKGIAIDGAGHKWIANQSTAMSGPPASSLTELSADGSSNLSPTDGFGSGSINGAYSVAIDASGNVWVADGGTTIIQFVGAAAPTRNPIVSAVTSGFAP